MAGQPRHLRTIARKVTAKRTVTTARRLLFALFCLCLPGLAKATLGDNTQSVETDRVALSATLQVLPPTQFTIHELQLPSGTKLREFVSSSGVVFAIAWRGPAMPNLKQALGQYFHRYAASANRQGGLHNRLVNDPDFVAQSSGHMRLFAGQAYVPQLLPPGVTVDQIQ